MTAGVPILIIGGGIGGMTAALALARAGFTAHIVERSPEFGEIGAGIQLAPNALRILDGLACSRSSPHWPSIPAVW
jgi:2-polyprenyl-6-methoxyphenol hydroxylase-like FAD-dependent oxidoreductase